MQYAVATLLLVASVLVSEASAHGWIRDPISRDAEWTEGYPGAVVDKHDDADICGVSPYNAPIVPAGCGPCGLADFPKSGPIVEIYPEGSTIIMKVQLEDPHWGWMSFKVCPTPDAVTDACFDANPLTVINSPLPSNQTSQYTWNSDLSDHDLKEIRATLPAGLTCAHCIFQWQWQGNHGPNVDAPVWRQCSDISILPPDQVPVHPAPVGSTATATAAGASAGGGGSAAAAVIKP